MPGVRETRIPFCCHAFARGSLDPSTACANLTETCRWSGQARAAFANHANARNRLRSRRPLRCAGRAWAHRQVDRDDASTPSRRTQRRRWVRGRSGARPANTRVDRAHGSAPRCATQRRSKRAPTHRRADGDRLSRRIRPRRSRPAESRTAYRARLRRGPCHRAPAAARRRRSRHRRTWRAGSC